MLAIIAPPDLNLVSAARFPVVGCQTRYGLIPEAKDESESQVYNH